MLPFAALATWTGLVENGTTWFRFIGNLWCPKGYCQPRHEQFIDASLTISYIKMCTSPSLLKRKFILAYLFTAHLTDLLEFLSNLLKSTKSFCRFTSWLKINNYNNLKSVILYQLSPSLSFWSETYFLNNLMNDSYCEMRIGRYPS